MTQTGMQLDEFTLAYIEAALWSSTDADGNPLDKNFTWKDIHLESLLQMAADCSRFQTDNAEDIDAGLGSKQAGHDFWLTRCGHGCGFWDGDWPAEIGKRLDYAAKRYPETDFFDTDDGLLHIYPALPF